MPLSNANAQCATGGNLGAGLVVDELEFRIAPQRRGPQRAERSTPGGAVDEADGIEDGDMRRLYIASRKRELA